jgi:hypothetical protein
VQGRRAGAGFAGERDADRGHPELREVQAEQVRVVLVVGVQSKAPVERGYGVSTRTKRRPPRTSTWAPAPSPTRPRRSEIRAGSR